MKAEFPRRHPHVPAEELAKPEIIVEAGELGDVQQLHPFVFHQVGGEEQLQPDDQLLGGNAAVALKLALQMAAMHVQKKRDARDGEIFPHKIPLDEIQPLSDARRMPLRWNAKDAQIRTKSMRFDGGGNFFYVPRSSALRQKADALLTQLRERGFGNFLIAAQDDGNGFKIRTEVKHLVEALRASLGQLSYNGSDMFTGKIRKRFFETARGQDRVGLRQDLPVFFGITIG